MPKIVKMGSGRLKTDISVEIWKSNFFMITILPLLQGSKKEFHSSGLVFKSCRESTK
ncbi:hypothetical protein O3M35_008103 [Rhynocoris fuscipes]|uniref:Uncharacterized protein n=1 Tax=Rhynocoris fuscipes TaxID=488301 RepID=A0AAW1D6D3_9HEMI